MFLIIFSTILFFILFLYFYIRTDKIVQESMKPYEFFVTREDTIFRNFLIDEKYELVKKHGKKYKEN